MVLAPAKYYSSDEIRRDWLSMWHIYRGKRNVHRGLVVNLKRRSYWKTLE
jgi:hypothetical protein